MGNILGTPPQVQRAWIPTADVRVGDMLAHKLSDTPWTYTRVTGWTDEPMSGGVTHRIFAVQDAPWWVSELDRTADLAGEALVMTCGSLPEREPAPEPAPEWRKAAPVTRVIMSDDWYGYRMPVPSRFNSDFMASTDDKWAILESIGIAQREGVSPLAAWRDAVADETGVPRAGLDPAQGGAFDAGFTPAYVRQFVFYLA